MIIRENTGFFFSCEDRVNFSIPKRSFSFLVKDNFGKIITVQRKLIRSRYVTISDIKHRLDQRSKLCFPSSIAAKDVFLIILFSRLNTSRRGRGILTFSIKPALL